MNANWTTKTGKKIEAKFTAIDGSSLVRVDYMRIDGKEMAGTSIKIAGIEFMMGGQKFVTPIPADVRNEINAMAAESGKITEAQKWAQAQEEKYQASYNRVNNAMSK